MTSQRPPLELAHDIAAAARAAGGHALVVGGFVRDRLLGLASKDLDLEVFGLVPDALVALLSRLGRVEPVGQSFPVFKIGAVDVALHRRRRPGYVVRRGGAPARLHNQRDRLGPAG
jgi:tRNA nucleotidyltransferase (CCA-adding enzyme)